ncbi:hypothetical protein ACW5W8_08740 [Aeromonas aquatilis]
MIGITRFAVNPKITAIDSFSQNCSSSLFLPARSTLSLCFMSQIGSSLGKGEATKQTPAQLQRARSLASFAGGQTASPPNRGKPFHKERCI